jgi:hypothetical protein
LRYPAKVVYKAGHIMLATFDFISRKIHSKVKPKLWYSHVIGEIAMNIE